MSDSCIPRWLEWAQEIQALAQTGCHYSEDEFQQERYQRLTEIAAEIISAQTEFEFTDLVTAFKAQKGYATPKVDVRAAVFRGGKLLLVREISDGGWCMPGGWADVGDVPSEAVEREVWEEAGFHVKARKVIGVYDANRFPPFELFHAFRIVFLCDLLDGEARASNETSAVDFFGQEEIPEPLSRYRTHNQHIAHAFAALKDDNWQTVFD
ncbi:MAG: NUDIX hydrolase N-terminal domain-containing protein [Chloroflexota bacterium]